MRTTNSQSRRGADRKTFTGYDLLATWTAAGWRTKTRCLKRSIRVGRHRSRSRPTGPRIFPRPLGTLDRLIARLTPRCAQGQVLVTSKGVSWPDPTDDSPRSGQDITLF